MRCHCIHSTCFSFGLSVLPSVCASDASWAKHALISGGVEYGEEVDIGEAQEVEA